MNKKVATKELRLELETSAERIAIESREASRRQDLRGRTWRRTDHTLGALAASIAMIAFVSATVAARKGVRPPATTSLVVAAAVVMGMRVGIGPDRLAQRCEARSRAYSEVGDEAIDFAEIDLGSAMGIDALTGRRDRLRERFKSIGRN
jgi:hypothetical protein